MRSVKEVSRITGVSVRALHYYDAIGLLSPSRVTESGYRYYDEQALVTLRYILVLKAVGFPLKEIGKILRAPEAVRVQTLKRQIARLEFQKEQLAGLITFARGMTVAGGNTMDFSELDQSALKGYEAQAKVLWGKTAAFGEYEERAKDLSQKEKEEAAAGLMEIFSRFGQSKDQPPESDAAQKLTAELQAYITEHFYHCTDRILAGLSALYAGGGSMTDSIDAAGGKGTGEFAAQAIRVYCAAKA